MCRMLPLPLCYWWTALPASQTKKSSEDGGKNLVGMYVLFLKVPNGKKLQGNPCKVYSFLQHMEIMDIIKVSLPLQPLLFDQRQLKKETARNNTRADGLFLTMKTPPRQEALSVAHQALRHLHCHLQELPSCAAKNIFDHGMKTGVLTHKDTTCSYPFSDYSFSYLKTEG